MNEKRILEMCDSPFVLSLEATFQDKHEVYLLLELALGGELFELLAKRESLLVSLGDAGAGYLSVDRGALMQAQGIRDATAFAEGAYHPAQAAQIASIEASIYEAGLKAATKKLGGALAAKIAPGGRPGAVT